MGAAGCLSQMEDSGGQELEVAEEAPARHRAGLPQEVAERAQRRSRESRERFFFGPRALVFFFFGGGGGGLGSLERREINDLAPYIFCS